MSAETITEPQGGLEIHRTPALRLAAQRGAPQGLFTDVRAESITDAIRHREADTIHCDAVAKAQRTEGSAPLHHHTGTTALNPPHRLHQPCEHGGFSGRFPFAIIG